MRRAIAAIAALLVAGCGQLPAFGPSTPASGGAVATAVRARGAQVPDRRKSWMARGAVSQSLLYVTNLGDWDAYVYGLPSLKLVGKITGLAAPQGDCSDKKGHVWIANSGSLQITEYAHAGTKPIATLSDPLGYPIGCAIDPVTGDLAVTTAGNASGRAEVLVYKHAAGTPRVFSNRAIEAYYFAGYDSGGNLYVSGMAKKAYLLGTLAKGRTSLSLIDVTGATIYFAGTIAFVGGKLILGDQRCDDKATSCLYQAAVHGATASITHKTILGKACDVAQAWVDETQVAGGDYESCGVRGGSADIWPFPAGGDPTARAIGLTQPVGATVSVPTGHGNE